MLIKGGQSYVKSDAALAIARNRYRFFGKQDACRIPTQELKSRFLE